MALVKVDIYSQSAQLKNEHYEVTGKGNLKKWDVFKTHGGVIDCTQTWVAKSVRRKGKEFTATIKQLEQD